MSFQKLTTECLRKVRPILHSQLPGSCQILNVVDLQLKGKYLKRVSHTQIYAIPETSVISACWTASELLTKHNSLYPSTSVLYIPPAISPKLDLAQISNAYEKLIDWNRPQYFEMVPLPFVPFLEKIIQEKEGRIRGREILYLLYLPEDVTKSLDLTKWEERLRGKFEIYPLTEQEYIKKMYDFWKYGLKGSDLMLSECINTLGCSRGIFRHGQRNVKGLVSWGMVFPVGTVGCLYTLDEARGSGLAIWTYAACCKAVADELGIIPICEVEHGNIASKSLMDKLGKKMAANVQWINYLPANAAKQK